MTDVAAEFPLWVGARRPFKVPTAGPVGGSIATLGGRHDGRDPCRSRGAVKASPALLAADVDRGHACASPVPVEVGPSDFGLMVYAQPSY